MAELLVPDPSVVLLVGAAGSGKSTFAARHFAPPAVLSSDALREAISGDAGNQAASRTAFAALHRSLDRRLEAGLSTVVDATNVTASARHAIRRIAGRHGVPVVVVVLDLPSKVVRARNAGRTGRRVPDAVVARQLEGVRATVDGGALAAEGYALVVHLQAPAEVDALVVRTTGADASAER